VPAPASHPVCEIARARDHVATPTNNDRFNIALRVRQTESRGAQTMGGIESPTGHKATRI